MTTRLTHGLSRESLIEHLRTWLSQPPDSPRALNDAPGGVCVGSWIGQRVGNEDEVVFCSYAASDDSASFKAGILTDGIGGLREGATAAHLAVGSFIADLVAGDAGSVLSAMERATAAANKTVHASLHGRGGCTLSAVLFCRGNAVIGNVGDSRIYGFTDSGIRQLTTDDTLAAYADSLGRKSIALPELHSLAQFVGMGPELDPKVEPLDKSLMSVVLTSDGMHFIGEQNLDLIRKHAPNARSFVQRAMHFADWLGGSDNASLAFVPVSSLCESSDGGARRMIRIWTPRGGLDIWLVPEGRPLPSKVSEQTFDSARASSTKRGQKKKHRKSDRKDQMPPRDPPELVIEFGRSAEGAPAHVSTPEASPDPSNERRESQPSSDAFGPLDNDPRKHSGQGNRPK